MSIKIRPAARLLAVVALVAAAASCRDVNSSDQYQTILQVLDESTAHGKFRSGLTAAGLTATLSGSQQHTLFAPTDAAFAALPEATRRAIEDDPDLWAAVIRNHVVASREPLSRLTDGARLTTLAGTQVTISRSGNTVKYGNATIILDNLGAENGVLHVIDQVVLPPGL